VKREVDEGVMNRIKVSFVVGGNSISSTVVAPSSGEMKVYAFDLSEYGVPGSVEVAPIFVSSLGKEKEGSVTSSVDLPTGTIREVPLVVYDLGRDYFYEVPTTGLVSWWKFDGDATDSVGENDGELRNGAQVVDGELVLDGVDDYVEMGNDESLQVETGDFSVSGWFYILSVKCGIVIIDKANNIVCGSSIYGGWTLSEHNGHAVFRVSDSVSVDAASVEESMVRLNQWVFAVGVKEGDNIYLYINGNLIGSADATGISIDTSNSLAVGGHCVAWAPNGTVDNVMIYNRALSPEEVVAIYDVQKKS